MENLVTWITQNLPDWEQMFRDDSGDPDINLLQNDTELAISEISEYVEVTPNDITPSLKQHLLNIIIKRVSDRLNYQQSYEFPPVYELNYRRTVNILKDYREGKLKVISNDNERNITVKRPLQGWFTP